MSAFRVVAGAVVDGGRVLAARRPLHKSQGGLWELPGGKVEAGESDAEALGRELGEELGLEVEVVGSLGESLYRYGEREVLLVGLLCRSRGPAPEAREHAELRWLDAASLSSVEWAPADLPLLDALRLHLAETE